ncbi:MAG: MBL fold metallo-hydrolase [Bacteroidia bacterium]|nr:MBL fold metallo-hydrolase [Bacteroidia bacterium]
MQITFHGAAQTVTGSKHLITTGRNKRLLLDCGLYQNRGGDNENINRHFGFDPAAVDYMILSHAHIDHSGNIPQLVKQGYKGPIYCTAATLDLCTVMLADSAHIQENDVVYLNKKRAKNGQRPLDPLYSTEDVTEALKQFVPVSLDELVEIDSHIRFRFTDAGHILGSAAVNLEFDEPEGKTKVFFSGDTGRYNDIIIRAPQPFPQADYILMESTYGDRLHETFEDAEAHLMKIVKETCVDLNGKLIIPAFSLGRTQEIVYSLNRLHNKGLLPRIPVYVDSPLAISATTIMKKHKESFNPDIVEYMKTDDDPFGFDNLHYIQDVESSKALNEIKDACIIISASGMMEAGRIKHHIKNNINDAINTILIVGYVPPGSLGGKLIEGATEVKIFGKPYPVKARIAVLDSYSAHADYKEMMQYLSCQNPALVRRMFLVHGEPEAQLTFKTHLHGMGFSDIAIPQQGETFNLE